MPDFKIKRHTLAAAAALIPAGARIHFGGMSVHNHPMGFIYELIRRGIRDLTVVGHVHADDLDILVGAGCVKRVETSYVGLEEFGLAPNFRRAVEGGEIELAEYSEPVCFERFACSARGQPFFSTGEMLGTDLPKVNPDIREFESPYDGRKVHLVPAAEPDWVVLHAPMADEYGNVLFYEVRQTPQQLDLDASKTTRNLIVTVEKIVSHEQVLHFSNQNLIPRFRTHAVVEVPFGAHPSSCLGFYDHDREQLRRYAEAARDPGGFREYLEAYVHGVEGQLGYLERVGLARLLELRHVGGMQP
jgi:glutaconate CoA-transferase subunit A